jgi:3-methyladenine DNA glycosylase AlkD
MDVDAVMAELRVRADPSRRPGMARVGIDVSHALGVSMPSLRAVAKTCGVDHALALELWETGIHEARILATLVADPATLTDVQRERWVLGITSWDLCDSAADLFGRTPAHAEAIAAWARRPEPFVKRCAFSIMARRAVWAKDAPDREFLGYLPLIRRATTDERNEVKKGVSWALRQIGKRNRTLNREAIDVAQRIHETGLKPAKWVASDALRELRSEKVQGRLAATPRRGSRS